VVAVMLFPPVAKSATKGDPSRRVFLSQVSAQRTRANLGHPAEEKPSPALAAMLWPIFQHRHESRTTLRLKKEPSMPKDVAAFSDESLYVLALFDGEVHVIASFQAEELNYS
jgi:hypothetical protein